MDDVPGGRKAGWRHPGDRCAAADARDPRPLQQHLAVVPARRHPATGAGRRLLQGAGPNDDRRGPRRCDPTPDGGMTFFERYFELLDGPDPHSSLELVADDVEFSIQWAAGADRRSSQFLGGREELRGFIDAGDTEGWAHHVVWPGFSDGVECALGETRYDESGERIGTFLAVAQLDTDGRMRRYMVARTPALAFPRERADA